MKRIYLTFIIAFVLCVVLLPSPTLASPSMATRVPGPTATHVVVKGDSLFSIATRYGMTVAELKKINGLHHDLIHVGQILLVTSSTSAVDYLVHTVVRGNTLFSIARRYGTTVAAIQKANGLINIYIFVGQRLIIPSSTVSPTESLIYTVVKDDTLYAIARRHHTSVDAIMAANRLSSTWIYVGQRLIIPASKITPAPPKITGTPTPTPRSTATSITTGTPTRTPTVTPTATPTVISGTGFGDGTYFVGTDIQPGTYRSTGTDICYWARLSGFSGEFDDIIANGVYSPEIVTINAGDAGFETRGCGQWVPVETTYPASPMTTFGDGTYEVNMHIAPGTYQASGNGSCYWERLSDFDQTFDSIIANGTSQTIVTINASDAGFSTFGCGTWTRLP